MGSHQGYEVTSGPDTISCNRRPWWKEGSCTEVAIASLPSTACDQQMEEFVLSKDNADVS